MFGINLGEFSVIAVIAIIVVGPERLPKYAQQLGRAVREARRMAMGLREQVREELGPEFEEVDWRKLDPRQYDPRRIIREALTEAWEDDDEPAREPSRPRTGSSVRAQPAQPGEPAERSEPSRGSEPSASTPAVTPYDIEAT